MKTLKGFLNALRVTPIYVDLFSSREDVFNQFAKSDEPDIQFLYANYNYENYSGYAVVLYYRKSTKKYYEVYGSHCSCYGLEDQWVGDEEIVAEELLKRNGELNRLFLEYQK